MPIARLTWLHPETHEPQSYDLHEGMLVRIGRAASNDISVPHVTVSRLHAIVQYEDGMFVLSDQGSSNGTFLNDQQIATPQPLVSGDRIRLYGPELLFSAVELDAHAPTTTPQDEATVLPSALEANTVQSVAYLLFLNGAQKDLRVPLAMKELRIGRATQNHTWEVGVQDSTVSRPHARLQNVDGAWTVQDLGSSNGTMVNGNRLTEKPKILIDSDIITVGSTMLQYRIGR